MFFRRKCLFFVILQDNITYLLKMTTYIRLNSFSICLPTAIFCLPKAVPKLQNARWCGIPC